MQNQFEVIRVYDPAIDSLKSDAVEYAITRDNKHISFKDGCEPVRFICQPFSHQLFLTYVSKGTSEEERTYRAFASCVKRVDNLDGATWVPERDDARILSERDMGRFSLADIMEVGNVCYQSSMLPKAPPPRFQLAPTSVLAWEAKVRAESHSAEQSRSAAHKSSENAGAP